MEVIHGNECTDYAPGEGPVKKRTEKTSQKSPRKNHLEKKSQKRASPCERAHGKAYAEKRRENVPAEKRTEEAQAKERTQKITAKQRTENQALLNPWKSMLQECARDKSPEKESTEKGVRTIQW